jgi:beta-glucosidase
MKLLALAFELVLWGAATTATQATNTTYPYMDPSLSVPERVANLLSLMTLEEKLAQMMQGDVSNWLNTTSGEFNRSGLVENMKTKAGQFYVGYPVSWDWVQRETERAQRYLVEETRLGIPALVQTEGMRKSHFHYLDGV